MKHRVAFRLLVLLLMLTVPMAACAPPAVATAPEPVVEEPAPEESSEAPQGEAPNLTLELIDGLDREVTLEAPATRIVSLAPSNTEILFAIGAGESVVGREEFSDYPEEALTVESIGSVFGDINSEAILALEPDLVLAAEINSQEQVEALAELGLTVFYLSNPVNFFELYDNLSLVGIMTGHEEEAEALNAELEARVVAVEANVSGREPVSVYYEVDATDVTAPYSAGRDTFQHMLLGLAGGTNVAGNLDGYPQLSQEELILLDPEVMIFGASPWVTTTAESVAARPGWNTITAVAEGRVYGVDSNWVDRPGPRLVDALEAFADILHPDA